MVFPWPQLKSKWIFFKKRQEKNTLILALYDEHYLQYEHGVGLLSSLLSLQLGSLHEATVSRTTCQNFESWWGLRQHLLLTEDGTMISAFMCNIQKSPNTPGKVASLFFKVTRGVWKHTKYNNSHQVGYIQGLIWKSIDAGMQIVGWLLSRGVGEESDGPTPENFE